MTKMTRTEMFKKMIEMPENAEFVDFLNAEIAKIEKRAEASKRYRQKKAAAADEMKELILSLLKEDCAITVEEIADIVSNTFEDVTNAKVVARLTKLINEGLVERATEKRDGHRVTVYSLSTLEADAE